MDFYTDVILKSGRIYLRGYKAGKRVVNVIKCKPYLFLESKKETEYKTLDGKFVSKKYFNSPYEARKFIEQHNDISNYSIYGITKFQYQFIKDFWPEEINYDVSVIKTVYIDIEVDANEETGFPDIKQAILPITAISLRWKDKVYAFGLKPWKHSFSHVNYYMCKDEKHLIESFLDVWNTLDPDIVTGWYIEFFDIPYLVNRITNVLGLSEAQRLSPWRELKETEIEINGRSNQVFLPAGITVLDYQRLYKKFRLKNQESYALDYIAAEELNEKKIDYSEYGSLSNFYKYNFEKYMEYNVRDIDLVYGLEHKLRYIELVIALAYLYRVNYNDTFATVKPWEMLIHSYLLDRNIVMPITDYNSNSIDIIGGYVKEPIKGMHDWVVSFDLTSLYPHLIMQYNISPETYVGMYNINATLEDIIFERALDDIRDDLISRNITIAANRACYTKEKIGFLPEIMKKIFDDRDLYKKKMKEASVLLQKAENNQEKQEYTNLVAKYNTFQIALKTVLNSGYGAIANSAFCFNSTENSEAITSSGQLSIRWVAERLNKFLNKIFKTENEDYIVCIDTDSVYLKLDKVFTLTDKEQTLQEKVDFLNKFCETVIQPKINKFFEELAEYTNSFNSMKMKRESISDRGIWTAKKKYVLHVLDNEGVRYAEPEIKITGIEAIRSSTPHKIRQKIKETLNIIMTKSEKDLVDYIEEFKKDYYTWSLKDIAFPRTANNLQEYSSSSSIYSKGCPIHVRGALLHNYFLKKNNLTNKYNLIYEGQKVRFCYMKVPNLMNNEDVFSFVDDIPELNLSDYIDYDKQFEKSYLSPITNILKHIGWKSETVNTLDSFMGDSVVVSEKVFKVKQKVKPSTTLEDFFS